MEPTPPAAPTLRPLVLFVNHQREDLLEVVQALRRAGYDVVESSSLKETRGHLQQRPPDLVVLNPLALRAGTVEFEMLEKVNKQGLPVPVILLVDRPQALLDARQISLPLRDFVMKPVGQDEILHRVELGLLNRARLQTLQQRTSELEGQVAVDFKTGLLTDRHFKNVLHVEWKRAQRHHDPLSLMLIDVDNFKQVNDQTEYAFGDEVLRRVALELRQTIRETDFAGRFGGDEFMLLLPQTSSSEAVQTAMRIRKVVAQMTIERGTYQRRVTISVGIDTYDGRNQGGTPEELWRRANKALQEAKRRGKDRVWLFSEVPA
jgi:diguanylate cyclase (GGDEF)-like protein